MIASTELAAMIQFWESKQGWGPGRFDKTLYGRVQQAKLESPNNPTKDVRETEVKKTSNNT